MRMTSMTMTFRLNPEKRHGNEPFSQSNRGNSSVVRIESSTYDKLVEYSKRHNAKVIDVATQAIEYALANGGDSVS